MTAYLIFPQSAWLNTELGFAGINNLHEELCKDGHNVQMQREYQAVILEIENPTDQALNKAKSMLPSSYQIPALINGKCCIISKSELRESCSENAIFQELMKDAHLEIKIRKEIEEKKPITLPEINALCDDFAHDEKIPMALIDFNIIDLDSRIKISENIRHKLQRILIDIKTNWFALDYDLTRLAYNSDESAASRFKRYMHISNAIVRIRTIWEKLIAFGVLLERPGEIDKILSARKVKSAFKKRFKNAQNPITKKIWDHLHVLDIFDSRFRTPELHKTGRAISWASEEKLGEETNRFLAFRNDLNRLLRDIIIQIVNKDELLK